MLKWGIQVQGIQAEAETFFFFFLALIIVLYNRPASLVAQKVKHLPAIRETQARFLGWKDPPEKEMAIHSSTLAWKIPWMEELDRLQSMGSQRVRHDWATSLSLIVLYRPFWCHHNGKAKEWTQWNIWKYEVMRRRMFHSALNVKIYNIQKHF